MARSDLYLHDTSANRWRPATIADMGGGGAADAATAANQAIAIATLQQLDLDNATEAQQIAISNSISSLQAAWLAENATEARQQEIIAKNEEIRALLNDVELNQDTNTAEIAKVFAALGYTGAGASTLNVRLQAIQERLGNAALVPALPDIRTQLKELKDAFDAGNSDPVWNAPANATISTVATDILPVDTARKGVQICCLPAVDERIYINIGGTAAPTSALFVLGQDQTLNLSGNESIGRISAIASAGTINYTIRTAV